MAAARNRIIVNYDRFHPPLRRELEERGLISVFNAWQPDAELLSQTLACFVWFYECLRHPARVWLLKQRLRRHGVPLVAWNRDAPHYMNRKPWRLDWLNRARLLDVYATHTLCDSRTFADYLLYLPNAADTHVYRIEGDPAATLARLRDPNAYRYDVSFFGGMDGKRYKEHRGREQFFTALSERLRARGISHLFREAQGMAPAEQIELIQSSRINLNYGASCEYEAPFASGLPERCYGIPACGGFLLCDRRTHAADDFEAGTNWSEFDGLDDAERRIAEHLDRFARARDIAERCYQHVMANHTYGHRATTLHEALLAWHRGERTPPRRVPGYVVRRHMESPLVCLPAPADSPASFLGACPHERAIRVVCLDRRRVVRGGILYLPDSTHHCLAQPDPRLRHSGVSVRAA